MTIDDFTKVTTEIESFYQKEISDEQKKIWFQELKQMDIKRFKYIISQVYRTCKFIPKLADLVEINVNLGYSPIKKEETTRKCNKCKGTGYMVYKKIIDNGGIKMENEYMAVCECGIQQKYEGWKLADEKHRSNYYTPLAVELGL